MLWSSHHLPAQTGPSKRVSERSLFVANHYIHLRRRDLKPSITSLSGEFFPSRFWFCCKQFFLRKLVVLPRDTLPRDATKILPFSMAPFLQSPPLAPSYIRWRVRKLAAQTVDLTFAADKHFAFCSWWCSWGLFSYSLCFLNDSCFLMFLHVH